MLKIHSKRKVILGIDPGLADTGYGLIEKEGANLRPLAYGSIKTNSRTAFSERLEQIHFDLKHIIQKYRPDYVGIEQLFFCKNVKTALAVGQARGVCLLTLNLFKLPYFEMTPLQMKLSLTGYGQASKNQIGQMVKTVLKLKNIPRPDDAADALAIAIACGHYLGKKLHV